VTDYKNLVIADLADENAQLREQNGRLLSVQSDLVDLIADLAWQTFKVQRAGERQLLERVHTDATLERVRRQQRGRAA
jgi:hypothetical protein